MNMERAMLPMARSRLLPVDFSSGIGDKLSFAQYSVGGVRRNTALKKAVFNILETQLTDRQSEMLKLYYINGVKMADIAQLYGLNVSTVCRHISGGKKRIRKIIEKTGWQI